MIKTECCLSLFVYVLIFETSDLTISHDFRDTENKPTNMRLIKVKVYII